VAELEGGEELLAGRAPEEATGVAAILEELVGVIERAKAMPLSSSAIIARDEVLALLHEAIAELPPELQRARRLLQDRDEVKARAELEASEVLDEARAQAAHLVQRTEVVRQARNQAERIIADAHSEARRIRHEADDYVDRKLAAFEIVLDRTMRTVQAGRARLGVIPGAEEEDGVDVAAMSIASSDDALFDQDVI
jgi:cell division septum initiation protein DivIVA